MKLTERKISYSVGRKISDNNFGSIDVHISESEAYEVEESDPTDIEEQINNKYFSLKERVDNRLIETANEIYEDLSSK